MDVGKASIDGDGDWPYVPMFSPSSPTSVVRICNVRIFVPSLARIPEINPLVAMWLHTLLLASSLSSSPSPG